jgi:hypothetical protein
LVSNGETETDKLTVPEKPFWLVTVMVELEVSFATTFSERGLAEIPKSWPAVTVTVRVVERTMDPLVPFTLIV